VISLGSVVMASARWWCWRRSASSYSRISRIRRDGRASRCS
jgi:hypothetical protein